jgi:pimeloyl-ACP methyl ester carboxylesterase
MFSLEEWKKFGEIIQYKENEIFYRDEGQGDVILCIHGYPSSSWDWNKVWPELIKNHRVIALDMVGFGFSSKPHNYKYSISDQADLHLELLKSLGIKSFHILAHDFGIFVGQELVARHDEGELDDFSVNSLCAMSGSIFPELYNPRLIQRLLLSPVGWLVQKLFSEEKFCNNLSSVFGSKTKPTKVELSSYWSLLQHNAGDKMIGKLLFYIEDRKVYGNRWVRAWQTTNLPVQLIIGLADPMYGSDSVERYKILTKQKNLECLTDVGHFPQVENPTEVTDIYKTFLRIGGNVKA